MKRMARTLLAALLIAVTVLTLAACGGSGDRSASVGAPAEKPQSGKTEQTAPAKKEVKFPELTPLQYWNRVDTFIEANAPADLAEFYRNYWDFFTNKRNYEEKTVDNFRCFVDKNKGIAVIDSYVGPADVSGELVIPAKIDGCRVLVGYMSDQGIPAGVTSMVVEDGVQGIYYCDGEGLTSVTLPDSLLVLWGYAFGGSALTEVDLPDSLYVVEGFNNTKLTEVTIPKNVIYVNGFGVTPLTSVTFEGDHVLALGKYAFMNCGSLSAVEIPDSVRYIHPDAFAGTSVTVPADRVFRD